PIHLRQTWMLMARGMVNAQSERDAEEVAAWISEHGEAAGFRIPNVSERGRAMGMIGTCQQLKLAPHELYDAQGNSFDRQAVMLRLQHGLRGWASGQLVCRHEYPDMTVVARAYDEVRH
ncbi:MAG: hypothetical protein ACKPKO_59560, partial [Candidatus Fonsibacter sp.]